MKIKTTHTRRSAIALLNFMRLWVISWTCSASVLLYLLCVSSRRLIWLYAWLVSSQRSCLSSDVTRLEKRTSLTTLSKVVLPPPAMPDHIHVAWFLTRTYYHIKLPYLCICSLVYCLLPSLLNTSIMKEQSFSVLFIARTKPGSSYTDDAWKLFFNN